MKLKSLLLGTVAAAGLTTAGFAADLGVLTSLDVCDSLGLTGITVSSDTNCLQISGGVSYEGNWGDFNASQALNNGVFNTLIGNNPTTFGSKTRDQSGFFAGQTALDGVYQLSGGGIANIPFGGVVPAGAVQIAAPRQALPANANLNNDWNSKVEAWLKFVGTSSTDVGPASVVIKLKGVQKSAATNEFAVVDGDTQPFQIDEGYVSIGSDTVLMIGKKGTIAKFDAPIYNFTKTFGYDVIDGGIMFDSDDTPKIAGVDTFGGQSIQLVTSLGEGVKAGIGLENLAATGAGNLAGSLVGVVSYAGAGVNAHATAFAAGILDGNVDYYGAHISADGTFDAFKVAGTFGLLQEVAANLTDWHGALSAQGTFDMFTIAVTGEAQGLTGFNNDYGFGASIGAKVTDGVSFNLGGNYFQENNGGPNAYHVAGQLVAAVTETIKLTAEVGVYGNNAGTSDFYGSGNVAWTPDTTAGGFTTSLGAEAHQNGMYKLTVKASKTFQ